MIAQFLLTALLAGVLLYAWTAYRRAPVIGLLSVLGGLTGLYFVWLPSHASRVAAWMGVGRGVDLILYVWVGISLIVLLNLHLKLRAQNEIITSLARAIALSDAIRSNPSQPGVNKAGDLHA